MGFHRRYLFKEAIEYGYAIPQTSTSCAKKIFVWFRLIGTLWPPATQLAIGADRAACILKPFWHRRHLDNKDVQLCTASLLFVVISLIAGFIIVLTSSDRDVYFYCGRKTTFSRGYTFYVYFVETFGYFIALFLSSIAYYSARKVQQTRAVKIQMRKIRYVLALGFLSSIFVAVPNIVSIISAIITRIVGFELFC
ncbi:unnamed protein product [Thelazia callipaeda]|uniref:G_PROTEIN_RECEP_F1_2 domain-containing protein n=1 Tax=Thelazia callipaeda TaxID=103827 RepID=A0A0N5D3A7_THECL|nr:unnamed protein product [Thelazia callipaeda]